MLNEKNSVSEGLFDRSFNYLFHSLEESDLERDEFLLSIVIPVYNEEKTVKKVILSLPKHKLSEVIIVDDHSTDQSFEKIKSLEDTIPNFKLIRHKRNQGYGKALLSGISNAKGTIIITMDSDGQHRAEDIYDLVLPILLREADITIGSRYVGKYNYNIPLSTRLGEITIEKFINILFRQKVMNNQGGFRAFHRKTLKIFNDIKFEDYAFTTEVLLKAALEKFVIKETPIHLVYREYGTSKIILTKLMLNILLCLVYYTIQWVNRPHVNKWMISRLNFLKKLPIYGKPKKVERLTGDGEKLFSIAYYNR